MTRRCIHLLHAATNTVTRASHSSSDSSSGSPPHLGRANGKHDVVTAPRVALTRMVCQHALWAVPGLHSASNRREPRTCRGNAGKHAGESGSARNQVPLLRLRAHLPAHACCSACRARPNFLLSRIRAQHAPRNGAILPCMQEQQPRYQPHGQVQRRQRPPHAAVPQRRCRLRCTHLEVHADAQPDLLQQPAAPPTHVGADQQGADTVRAPHRPLQLSSGVGACVGGVDACLGKGALRGGSSGQKQQWQGSKGHTSALKGRAEEQDGNSVTSRPEKMGPCFWEQRINYATRAAMQRAYTSQGPGTRIEIVRLPQAERRGRKGVSVRDGVGAGAVLAVFVHPEVLICMGSAAPTVLLSDSALRAQNHPVVLICVGSRALRVANSRLGQRCRGTQESLPPRRRGSSAGRTEGTPASRLGRATCSASCP